MSIESWSVKQELAPSIRHHYETRPPRNHVWDGLLELNCVVVVNTHRLHSSSFLGLPYRVLNINMSDKKELLWSL